MFYQKRFNAAIFMGLIAGVLCFITGKYVLGLPLTMVNFWFILLNRTMIGFAVGISCIKSLSWPKHGALMGFVVGTIFAYADAMLGFSWWVIVAILMVNPFFGWLIEFGTTKLFEAPMK